MRVHSSRPVVGLSAIRSRTFQHLFGEYERRLIRTGYHHKVARLHLQSIALPPNLRRGVFQVEDRLIAWLSGKKISGVHPWPAPIIDRLAVPSSS